MDAAKKTLPPSTRNLGPFASNNGPIRNPQKKVRNSDRLKIHPISLGVWFFN